MSTKIYSYNYHCIYKRLTNEVGDVFDVMVRPGETAVVYSDVDNIVQFELCYGIREYAAPRYCIDDVVIDYLDNLLYDEEIMKITRCVDDVLYAADGRKFKEEDTPDGAYLYDLYTGEGQEFKEALFTIDGDLYGYVLLNSKHLVEDTSLPVPDVLLDKHEAEYIANAVEYAAEQAKDSGGEINAFTDELLMCDECLELAQDMTYVAEHIRRNIGEEGAIVYNDAKHTCKVCDK